MTVKQEIERRIELLEQATFLLKDGSPYNESKIYSIKLKINDLKVLLKDIQ